MTLCYQSSNRNLSIITAGSQPELLHLTIDVLVNGECRELPAEQSIASLLHSLNIPSDRVAIELNKSIVRKRDWESTMVAAGSQIEIVEFVGGG
jgi:thiamine biosynthesis protein ThiS